MKTNRRDFVKMGTVAGVGIAGMVLTDSEAFGQKKEKSKEPVRHDPGLVRVGFIGIGGRGSGHVHDSITVGGVDVVSICDISQAAIDRVQAMVVKNGMKAPKAYTGSDHAFEEMLKNEELDAVIIATPWEWHVPMAIASMKAGVPYTGVEVSAANTLEECWDLVNVHEQTGNQVMIMENVCYRRDVMAILNMVRTNLFGELVHCRCGYEHDLRGVKFDVKTNELKIGKEAHSEAQWRGLHAVRRNGDLYPTHGLGPIGVYLDINRGNRFLTLSAMATKARGLSKFIDDHVSKDHPYHNINFNLGDIVTSMIKCANGETIIVTHDTNLPRPYSLGFRVQGTNGLWKGEGGGDWTDAGEQIYVEGKSKPHVWDKAEEWLTKYDHQYWREKGEKATGSGHGGMDFIMLNDFFDAVRNKKQVPLDAYDAAAWSAVSALSEMSVARGGALVDFPDFTRGQWIKREPGFARDTQFPIAPERDFINNLF
jgi:predicted dehydrogenase